MDDSPPPDAMATMARAFDADALAPCDWRHGDTGFDAVEGDFHRIWRALPGGHKKYACFRLYEKVFGAMRSQPVSFLEIGVFQGASLHAWARYLGPQAQVIGLDVDPDCRRFEDAGRNIHVRIGDQADPAFLRAVAEEFGSFDAVLDDGSHVTAHQIASFNALFFDHLKPGGVYFIEDTNTSLWRRYRHGPRDIFDLIGAAAMALHCFYAAHDYARYSAQRYPGVFSAPRAAAAIEELRVFDAAVAIYRASATHFPPLVLRRD